MKRNIKEVTNWVGQERAKRSKNIDLILLTETKVFSDEEINVPSDACTLNNIAATEVGTATGGVAVLIS